MMILRYKRVAHPWVFPISRLVSSKNDQFFITKNNSQQALKNAIGTFYYGFPPAHYHVGAVVTFVEGNRESPIGFSEASPAR